MSLLSNNNDADLMLLDPIAFKKKKHQEKIYHDAIINNKIDIIKDLYTNANDNDVVDEDKEYYMLDLSIISENICVLGLLLDHMLYYDINEALLISLYWKSLVCLKYLVNTTHYNLINPEIDDDEMLDNDEIIDILAHSNLECIKFAIDQKLLIIDQEFLNEDNLIEILNRCHPDIIEYFAEQITIGEKKNEILSECVWKALSSEYSVYSDLIKKCIALGADAHINDSSLLYNCFMHYKLEIAEVLIYNNGKLRKMNNRTRDLIIENYICRNNWKHCELRDHSKYAGEELYQEKIRCGCISHDKDKCDCELSNVDTLYFIIDHGANYKDIFHSLLPDAKEIIARRVLAASKIKLWVLKIFSKPYYNDGTIGFLARQSLQQIERFDSI